MSHALRARAIWKSYAAGIAGCSARAWVLRGLSLDVQRGECLAVLGARGAGATTLLHCLAGLRRPDAGSIELALTPLLVQSQLQEEGSHAGRLLLVDDALSLRRHARHPLVVREHDRNQTLIIATHELARVRDVADRILLLHHGRLHPFDLPTATTRVAEPRVNP